MGILCLRDTQVLGLAPGHLAVEARIAEERGAHALIADLSGLALGVQAGIAHVAVAAGDLERDHHAVTDLQVPHLGAHLLDDAHRFVAQDVALGHECTQYLVQMQVGTADVGGGDSNDRVGRLLDPRIRDRIHTDLAFSLPGDCSHCAAFSLIRSPIAFECPAVGHAKRATGRWVGGCTGRDRCRRVEDG